MKNSFIINQTDIIYVIHLDQIMYCCADRSYCSIYLVNDEIITYTRTLSNLSIHLNENFIRISHSIVVNKQHIRKILKKSKSIELMNAVQLLYTIKSGELIDLLSVNV